MGTFHRGLKRREINNMRHLTQEERDFIVKSYAEGYKYREIVADMLSKFGRKISDYSITRLVKNSGGTMSLRITRKRKGKWSPEARARQAERMKARWQERESTFKFCPHCGKQLKG